MPDGQSLEGPRPGDARVAHPAGRGRATRVATLVVPGPGQPSAEDLMAFFARLPEAIAMEVVGAPGALLDELRAAGLPVRSSSRLAVGAGRGGLGRLALGALTLRRMLRTDPVDLVHARALAGGTVAALSAATGGPRALVELGSPEAGSAWLRVLTVPLTRCSGIVAATSEEAWGRVRQVAPGVECRLIRDTIAPRSASPPPARGDARAALGLSPWTFALGVVGSWAPGPAVAQALDVLAALKTARAEARLVVIAPGSDGPASESPGARELETRARALDVDRLVLPVGPEGDRRATLRGVDLLLVPVLEHGSIEAVLEAMSLGVPVVARKGDGLDDILGQGEAGLLLERADPQGWATAVVELMDDRPRRTALGASGRERASLHSPDVRLRAILDCYSELAR